MLWRNLLLLAALPLGVLAVVASLFPKGTPDHWEQAASTAAEITAAREFDTKLTALNQLFADHWRSLGIEPAPSADDFTLLRRISLGLTGTIPSLEEIRMVQSRVAARRESDAPLAAWWTAGLLGDPRSSDYLAERFARAFVGTNDGPFLIYRRRRFVSWLADELHANRPYDQIVTKLISADGLWTSEPATNFITVSINAGMEGKGPDETKLAGRVYRAFLGIRVDCAQCHDHPFADWKQEDFHGLASFFGRTEQSFTGIREGRGTYVWVKHQRAMANDDKPSAKKSVPEKSESPRPDSQKPSMADDETADNEPAPVDASPNEGIEQRKLRQDPNAREGEPAVPYASELLGKTGNRRQRLAAWVTHPENKPFARAVANRVWALMFGRPIIDPVDDIPYEMPDPSESNYFGMRVLSLLGDDFVRHGYDLRRLMLLIAQSEPFQRQAYEDPAWSNEELDRALDAWATFRVSRLRPEQVSGAILQSASVQTIDRESHVIFRIQRAAEENQFITRYGDEGDDELLFHSGTIPQRLLMLNGELLKSRTSPNPVLNGATHVAMLAPDDETALSAAYLSVLTREPTATERGEFLRRLQGKRRNQRQQVLEDIYATLLNSWEASWNH